MFVDDESGRPPAVLQELVDTVAADFQGLVRITTARPDADPHSYKTVVLGAPVGWYARTFQVDAIGYAEVSDRTAYVAGLDRSIAPTRIVSHELGHLFGLGHSPDPTDIMYPTALDGEGHFSPAELTEIANAH